MKIPCRTEWKPGLIAFSIVVLCGLGWVACGGGDSRPAEAAAASSVDAAEQPAAAEKAPGSESSAKTPAGWQTVDINDWKISLPPDWNEIPRADIWQPGEIGPFQGRPPLSFHSGGIPVMPPADFEKRVKVFTGGDFQERVDVTVAGMSGFKCTWEQMGKKHRGLFLEEKVGGGMIVVNLFDCQAPADEFDQNTGIFEKILDSVHK